MTLHASAVGEDQLAWLRFTLVSGIPGGAQRELLRAFGSPQGVLSAGLRSLGKFVDAERASALAKGPSGAEVERACRWLEQPGRHLVALGDEHYPRAVLETADPPAAMYVQGRLELLNAPAIAIVGSRNATAQGVRDAEGFAQALSEAGLVVVSGLALGIDAAAHRGGLRGRSASIAVMGTGPERIYPSRNRELGEALATRGAVVTEFPLGTSPLAGNFPRRNRIISALARGVLVVEAALQSGSLITARLALEEGRDVFAMPGSIHSPLAKGCHQLIRQGAKLVESAEDILAEFGMRNTTPEASPSRGKDRRADPVLEAMGFAPVSLDEIVERTGGLAAGIAVRLTELEIEGRVASLPGGRFQRLAPS